MAKIFINYRRKDSAPYAGRLYDRLAGHFGHDHVFMDIDQIEPGEVFDQVIEDKLAAVQAAVVLIGEHWLDIADANGQRRLDDPDDWVRLEIAAVLERGIRVIPVLVGGATMPKSTQLPECLVPLTRRQAIEITDHRFHADTDKLIKALEKIVGVPVPPKFEPPKKPEEPEKPGLLRFAAIAGVIGIGIVGFYFGLMPPEQVQIRLEPENPVTEPIAATERTEIKPIPAKQLTDEQPQVTTSEPKPVPPKKPAVEQLQSTTPEPITQPVTEPPKAAAIEPDMVRIPSGKFRMGSPETEEGRQNDEGPQHEVTISRPFALSRHEITVGQFRQFVEDAGYQTTAEQSGKGCYVWNAEKKQAEQLPERNWKNPGFKQNDGHPAVCVSWDDAQAYVKWLSQRTGAAYRLPTEAEWEYAARAGTTTARFYPDGQQCQYANGLGQEGKAIAASDWVLAECTDDYVTTAPVGRFKSNPYGLSDMLGNVSEWTQDCWHDNYNNAPSDGSAWLDKDGGDCSRRVVRGGSWNYAPQDVRSAGRLGLNAGGAIYFLGFRIARDF